MQAKINQLSKIRVGIVNYLNTKPLLYGIEHAPVRDKIELIPGYPAIIAAMLLEGKIDVGLVPVAIIPGLPEAHIITDYCIGCDGEVASVCLLSNVPLQQIKKVLLDYQSRTSTILVKILFEKYWKLEVEWADTQNDFRNQISGTTAGLVIGDRCLEYRVKVDFVYDLGEAWKDFTGLPFVFAAWIANKKLPKEFIEEFNQANKIGLLSIDKVVAENPYPLYDLDYYYHHNISYHLTADKRKGLDKFLSFL